MWSSARFFAVISTISALALVACGDDGSTDPCRDAPTFTNDIAALNADRCLPCHDSELMGAARNGAPEDLDFDDFALVEENVEDYANAITSGLMPPQSSEYSISKEERMLVEAWRRCGFTE